MKPESLTQYLIDLIELQLSVQVEDETNLELFKTLVFENDNYLDALCISKANKIRYLRHNFIAKTKEKNP